MASAVLALAIPVLALTAFPLTSEAGHKDSFNSHRRVVDRCGKCHQDIYKVYQYTGIDRCGHPKYAWRKQPHHCRHTSHHRGHDSHRNNGHESHSNHGYQSRSSHGYSIYDYIRHFR